MTRPQPLARAVPALLAVAVVLALVPSAAPAAAAPTQSAAAQAEAQFVGLINQLRGSRGLAPLAVHGELTARARSWAATMASAGRIFHASDLSAGITANWVKLGENVGVGGDVGSLFDAFVASPSHLANLVDPAYGHVGVGVVVAGDRIYTAHRFMAVAPDAPPPPPPPPSAPPTSAPPTTSPPTTAPPTTLPPATTTTAPPATTTTVAPFDPRRPVDKLGDLERIPAALERAAR